MSDIFGRSTIAPTNVITKKQISSMIRKYVTSGLNLVGVDPGEIVVFGDKQGKLKTSNISLDSLLTIPKDAADDSIAVFKQGKITAGDKLSSITSSVTQLRNEYEAHVANFAQLRRNFNTADNTIEKFFGKKNIKPDEVTTTLPDLKKSIEDIKQNIANIKTVTEKVKIPHNWIEIESVSYVVRKGFDIEYLQPAPGTGNRIVLFLSGDGKITGIYRFSLISEHQFNIKISHIDRSPLTFSSQGVNVVLFKFENKACRYEITPVDPGVVRATYGYIVEYLSPI